MPRHFEELIYRGLKIFQINDKTIQRKLRQAKRETGEKNKGLQHRKDTCFNYKCNTCGSRNKLHPDKSECFVCGTNNFSVSKIIDLR